MRVSTQPPVGGCYRQWLAGLALVISLAGNLEAQNLSAVGGPRPNLVSNIERPLRYRPDRQDFVIENGTEFFNRPLYGGNTAFRVDAGDKPEFVLYLPGRGGNLRFGLRTAGKLTWLFNAAHVVTRYRPGEMNYEIRDPVLGANGMLRLAVVALPQTEGLIARVEAPGIPNDIELVWAYGGVNGERGRRDGDIGTESVPISEWFQFRPDFCRDNTFTIAANRFTLSGASATIVGITPNDASLSLTDAGRWNDPPAGPDLVSGPSASDETGAARTQGRGALLAGGPALPILMGHVALTADHPFYLALQRVGDATGTAGDLSTYREVSAVPSNAAASTLLPPFTADELPRVFAEATSHFAALRHQIAVETPDPYLNAAVAALNVAADAAWDASQGDIMHGAIAWRTRLLGWRGPYALDALGWHDRARQHFRYWATRQNTDPIPAELPPPDEKSNLARSEAALHSNGDLSNSHYDMNLVYIDALFRHLLWTGDRELARELWPVIARHLAWERRLFRREFATASEAKLPLYEAYAAIWASDDLEYNGGGTAHASAYNYWHNHMAACVARWLGEDPESYETEAELIARGMRELLWVPEWGVFGEFKDYLGRQLVHPSAAIWSIYHPIDSELTRPFEAQRMLEYVNENLPWLPVRGPGVPDDASYGVFASSNWMPYSWSINNVVMGENLHLALAYWQAGRVDEAYRLMKSALLASMYMGVCPGNVGSMNYLDVYRRESQRDFADGSGVLSRAIVEELFGIRPDAIAGKLRIAPGFPAEWDEASIETPDVRLRFRRRGGREELSVTPARPWRLEVELPAHARTLVRMTEQPREMDSETVFQFEWSGDPVRSSESVAPLVRPDRPTYSPPSWSPADAVFTTVDLTAFFNDRVTEIFRPGKYRSPRSPFASLAIPAQGIGAWAGHVNAMAEIDDSGLRRIAGASGGRFVLPAGVPLATPGPGTDPNILFTSMWDNYPDEATVPLSGRARRVHLLMAGSTNHMQSRFDNGEVVVRYADGSTFRLALRNPATWWPIEQDYFIDDFQFRRPGPVPPRVDLKTGEVRHLDVASFKGQGGAVPGGAATVLELGLDPAKDLQSLTVRALANEVVIGLMAVTLEQ